MQRINYKNKRFGRLVVIKLNHTQKRTDNSGLDYYFLCKCDCGNTQTVRSKDLGRGTSSCGCLRKELAIKRHTTHGFRYTPFYRRWNAIKNRCLNKKVPQYKDYGGRGIKICKEWLKFENFKNDMYKGYLKHKLKYGEFNTSIERIDNNGNYCKENCAWITRDEQAKNKSNKRIITIDGIEKSLTEWAKIKKISVQCLSYRIKSGYYV